MKVLVTGGSGFIGVHLVDLLRNQKYTVLNLDISKPINNTNIDLWRNVSVTDKELLAKELIPGCHISGLKRDLEVSHSLILEFSTKKMAFDLRTLLS